MRLNLHPALEISGLEKARKQTEAVPYRAIRCPNGLWRVERSVVGPTPDGTMVRWAPVAGADGLASLNDVADAVRRLLNPETVLFDARGEIVEPR